LRKETDEKQAKLEVEALKEFEAKKAEEERLREEEAKKTGKAPPKAPVAKKVPGKDEKPQLDVPKIPMPEITDFESVMGNKYVREREFEEIAEGLLDPPKEDEGEEEVQEEEGFVVDVAAANAVPTAPVVATPSAA
jgi:hypothetical protein